MKQLFLSFATLFAAAALLVSCGDDNKPSEPAPSPLTPDEHKARLEQIGRQFVGSFDPEDSRAAIESLSTLLDLLEPEYYSLSTAARTMKEAATSGNPALLAPLGTRAATEFYSIAEALGSTGGVLTYDPDMRDWEIENNDSHTVEARYADARHNSVLRLDYSASHVTYNYRGETEVEVPDNIRVSLQVDGREQLSLSLVPNLSIDGRTIRPHVELTLNGGYALLADADANPSYVAFTGHLSKNGTELASAYAKAMIDGMTDPDHWIYTETDSWSGQQYEYFDPESYFADHVKTGECSLQILSARLVAQGNIRAIVDGVEQIDRTWSKEGSEQEAALYNRYASAQVVYADDNTKLADIRIQSYLDYSDPYGTYDEYDIEPVLVFSDASSVSFRSFFDDRKFSSLVDSVDDLLRGYRDLFDR